MVTETAYDALDRVVQSSRKGATPAEDLVTTFLHSPLGDLAQTVFPRGNVEERSFDPAGRMVATERKPDPATPGERALFALDAAGNRTRVDLQRWNGLSWVTERSTS